MIRRWLALSVLAAAFVFIGQSAGAEDRAPAKSPAKVASWTGEIVDMGCYTAHAATGEKHKECGTKCVANGMPMGLLTHDGKVLLLCLDHDNADRYKQCKDWVGDKVEVTGTLQSRGGISAIDVTGAKAVTPAAK